MIDIPVSIDVNFSKESGYVLQTACRLAAANLHAALSPAHLLQALLQKDVSTHGILLGLQKDIYYLEEWAEIRMEELPKAMRPVAEPPPGEDLTAVFQEADQVRFELGKDEIDPADLLAAICVPGVAFSYDQLKTFPLGREELIIYYNGAGGKHPPLHETGTSQPGGASPTDVLQKYCVDMALQESAQFNLIGREPEIKICLEVLSRFARPNLVIVGDPGVGKTALLNGLAARIASGRVPDNLKQSRIYELDMAALQAGATYKGELEDRFQKIIAALKKLEKPILFIEEIHSLLDRSKGYPGLASLLTVELNRGTLTVTGTTTHEHFRKSLEPDESFSRRFEALILQEPDAALAVEMIREAITPYCAHHRLQIEDEGLREAVRLSQRYSKQRRLPDSAIDLIDRCMAGIRIAADTAPAILEQLRAESEKTDRILYRTFYQATDPLLKNHYAFELPEPGSFAGEAALSSYLEASLPEVTSLLSKEVKQINNADLALVTAEKTGIPVGKIRSGERDRLLNMEQHIKERVIGQDSAVKSVVEAILESRSGLVRGGQPIGSFFFLGPTGTGKTELAKALSEFLFQDERALIRFDMSEFKEAHSAALLYGAPPGYVGYEEGGMLVNKIRQQPYSVVLFDEIEKAHPSVFDIFLQILDEGRLHDRLGKEGDFSNAVVLFTSNIGSDHIVETFMEQKRLVSGQELQEVLAAYFRPEFLGRLTEIVPFAPIGEDIVSNIFDIHLQTLLKSLQQKGIDLKMDPETRKHLADSGYSPRYGARPLKGVIRDKIRRPLSRMIVEEKIHAGDRVDLQLGDQGLTWNIRKNNKN